MYLRITLVIMFLYILWYIYKFISINKNQIAMIFKRGKFFYSNPYIKQEIVTSTLKFLLKLLRKSFFKF